MVAPDIEEIERQHQQDIRQTKKELRKTIKMIQTIQNQNQEYEQQLSNFELIKKAINEIKDVSEPPQIKKPPAKPEVISGIVQDYEQYFHAFTSEVPKTDN